MKHFVVRANFSTRCREAHVKAMEMEKASGGKKSYPSFLPDDMNKMRPYHVDYNRALKRDGKLLCAGPLTDYTCALFIYIVNSEEEAKALIEADPFFNCAFFTDYEIEGWFYRI
jgi:uncharacterized protein YciI